MGTNQAPIYSTMLQIMYGESPRLVAFCTNQCVPLTFSRRFARVRSLPQSASKVGKLEDLGWGGGGGGKGGEEGGGGGEGGLMDELRGHKR